MRKLFLLSVAYFGFIALLSAQDISPNAIGLRLGDSNGFGTEISYQRALSDNNRLEFDLGWRSGNNFDGSKLTGLYQWVWNLDGNFDWYAGVGGGLASFDDDNYGSDSFIFAAGDIGIEYSFEIPLQISLDFRPEFGFGNNYDNNYDNSDLDFDIGLGIRYLF
jgi:hypothetical protein